MGTPCEDAGESLPLHGSIANTPAERIWWETKEDEIRIHAVVPDEGIFSHRLVLERTIRCSLLRSEIVIRDTVTNEGDADYPAMILYHMNMGYPLLSEQAELYVPSAEVVPRNERAAEGLHAWDRMEKPQAGFEEQCYFHRFEGEGLASIYNPQIGKGLAIRFDPGNGR